MALQSVPTQAVGNGIPAWITRAAASINSIVAAIGGSSGSVLFPTIALKSTAYAIQTTDQGNLFKATATMAFTLPSSVTARAGWSCRVGNWSTIAAPISVTVLRAGADTIDVDAATTVYVLPGEVVTFTADGAGAWITQGRTLIGRVINEATFSDAGSTTTSLSLVNMNAVAFTYQPISVASLLEIHFMFQGQATLVSAVNNVATYQITETTGASTGLGNQYTLAAASGAGGLTNTAPVSVIVRNLTNSAITTRKFNLFAKTANASGAANGQNILATIREIQNG